MWPVRVSPNNNVHVCRLHISRNVRRPPSNMYLLACVGGDRAIEHAAASMLHTASRKAVVDRTSERCVMPVYHHPIGHRCESETNELLLFETTLMSAIVRSYVVHFGLLVTVPSKQSDPAMSTLRQQLLMSIIRCLHSCRSTPLWTTTIHGIQEIQL